MKNVFVFQMALLAPGRALPRQERSVDVWCLGIRVPLLLIPKLCL